MFETGNKAVLLEVALRVKLATAVSVSAITKLTGVGVPVAHKI